MGRLPMSSVLGFSMMSLASMIVYITIQNGPYTKDDFRLPLAVLSSMVFGIPGAASHILGLNPQAALRSLTFGFVGGNIGFGWLIFSVDKALWLDYGLWALVPGALGMVLGVLVHEGDPQEGMMWQSGDGEKKAGGEKSE